MGFPTSVQVFTTKLDGPGNTIQAEHINTPQTEIAAIEAGYLNATARLNSSNSTLSALSVTNGSTFVGNIVLGSSVTLTLQSTVGVSGNVLQSNGSSGVVWGSKSALTVVNFSTTASATSTDSVLLCIGTWTLSLPTAVGNKNLTLYVKNQSTASTGVITLAPNGAQMIDGTNTITVNPLDDFTIISDSSHWWIL